jgi:CRP-like cAMP-binding protein
MVSVDVLKHFSLFEGMDDRILKPIAEVATVKNYGAGTEIFHEGDKAEPFYLLLKGKIAVERQLPLAWPNPVVTIHTVGEHQLLGWSAMVKPGLRTASARCLEDSEVVTIQGKDLVEILDHHPAEGYQVMKRLADMISVSLANTNEKLLREMATVESYGTQAPRKY